MKRFITVLLSLVLILSTPVFLAETEAKEKQGTSYEELFDDFALSFYHATLYGDLTEDEVAKMEEILDAYYENIETGLSEEEYADAIKDLYAAMQKNDLGSKWGEDLEKEKIDEIKDLLVNGDVKTEAKEEDKEEVDKDEEEKSNIPVAERSEDEKKDSGMKLPKTSTKGVNAVIAAYLVLFTGLGVLIYNRFDKQRN